MHQMVLMINEAILEKNLWMYSNQASVQKRRTRGCETERMGNNHFTQSKNHSYVIHVKQDRLPADYLSGLTCMGSFK